LRCDQIAVIDNLSTSTIDELYRTKLIPIHKLGPKILDITPYQPLILKAIGGQSALGIVSASGSKIKLVSSKPKLSGIEPRNKEQQFFAAQLLDPKIPLNIAIGRSGCGKTLLSLAAAITQVIMGNQYSKIILTKPMEIVGSISLGALPGDVHDKFSPYAINYMHQFSELLGDNGQVLIDGFFARGRIQYVPIQLMRGASFKNAFIIADEVQVLNQHEMLTLCTRVGAESKLVLLGDLAQRDKNIAIPKTGLYKMLTSNLIKESPLASTICLIKNERSALVDLVDQVLGDPFDPTLIIDN